MRRTIQALILVTVTLTLFGATTVHVSKVPEGVEITNKKVKVKPGYAFQRATAVRVRTKIPEGAEIRNGEVWLKPGYTLQRGSSNKFYSIAAAGASKGTKTGTYQCDCDKGGGSCSAEQTSKSSMKCVAKNG